jgi:hypothetical protein
MQELHEMLRKAAGETAQLRKAAHKAAGSATTCAEDAANIVLALAKTSGTARGIQAQRAQMSLRKSQELEQHEAKLQAAQKEGTTSGCRGAPWLLSFDRPSRPSRSFVGGWTRRPPRCCCLYRR